MDFNHFNYTNFPLYSCDPDICLPPPTQLGEGYVITPICLCVCFPESNIDFRRLVISREPLAKLVMGVKNDYVTSELAI